MGPRDPSGIYPFNVLDLVRAAAWAPPNLPLFPGAPAPTAVSTPEAGAPPWLRPLHEIQQAALSRNLSDPAFPDDTAASQGTSNGSGAPAARAAASPYTGAAAANPYLGPSAGDDALDPARTLRLLKRAKRDLDFVRWISGVPDAGPAQPMQYVAPAADAPRSGAPMTGIDDAVDQPAPFNRPPASSSPRLPLSAARKADVVPREGSYLSIVSPQGAILAPRMIDVAGGAGPANAPEGPDLVSLAEHGMLPRLLSPLPAPPAPAASSEDEPKLTNNASWDRRTWSAYDNPLAWLQLDYERKFPTEAARLKRMPMGGDVPAFDAPSAARRMSEAFATGYGDQPIIPTRDPASITKAGSVTIPEWARPHVVALMRAGNSLPQALDQVLRAGRGAIAMVPAAGAGAAQDLGIADQQAADTLQGELGIFMQFPGEPGVPSLAVAPRLVPETVGQRALRRAEERPPLPVEMPEPNVGPFDIADFRARHNISTTHTIAVGRTNVPGLEDITFEGASPEVWKEAKRPLPPPGKYESPSPVPRGCRPECGWNLRGEISEHVKLSDQAARSIG